MSRLQPGTITNLLLIMYADLCFRFSLVRMTMRMTLRMTMKYATIVSVVRTSCADVVVVFLKRMKI